MRRKAGWRSRFAAEMDRQRRNPFEWGKHDCAIGLACGAIKAITGEDLRSGWETYSTPEGALRALKKAGFATLPDLVSSILPEHEHPSRAVIGDIGVIETDGPIGTSLCVFDGGTVIILTEDGQGRRPRDAAIRAFKVGNP